VPTRPLPRSPDFEDFERQALELMRDREERLLQALQRIREFHPRFARASDDEIRRAAFGAADAELTIAREYGFASWPRLRTVVEQVEHDDAPQPAHLRITDGEFRRAVDLLDAGDAEGLRELLRRHPELTTKRVSFEGTNYFREPSLLEFIAENPTRNGSLPQNAAEIASIIIEMGARDDRRALDGALELVASSRVARESGVQRDLIRVLCEAGADSNAATLAPLLYGEFEAVEELVRMGAGVDLIVACATGRIAEARNALAAASDVQRRQSLSLAAQYGHVDIVRLLIEAGVDPNQFAPPGGHSHAMPLHQAALAGHTEVVRLLVEHGARADIRDILYASTPLDWARHNSQAEVVQFLTLQTT
jgi:hypothetical protein